MKLSNLFKTLIRPVLAIALVFTLVFSQADNAMAASGGRIGGGSFRMPSRGYSSPGRTYAPPGGGGYYPGGGGGFFPFVYFPFFGVGGGFGGLFTLLIFISIASFLVNSFRRAGDDNELGYSSTPTISVAKVQVGLLAEARELKADLDRIGEKADTSSSEGLAQVLQEASLALLRNPQYWVYGTTEAKQTRLEAASGEFNRLALSERSKFSAETLSNVNNQLKQASSSALTLADKDSALAEAPGEYIVVTLLVGTQGKLQLPEINSAEDLRRSLSQLGSVSSDQLLALEVLWTPQADGDVLTRDDLLAEYPNLKLV
ncbi:MULTISPECIES: DUF1517 domain-containing protein [Leptolyngbya]|jgi:uncharacterized membrane protein|uniref:DUF1517 domain-containing protein n=1 Tax=Leptolyngbya boryana NIES-2135 TaxID=1973484 RepID=A0A1Z4JFP3_LEPBY|nr:MULTISPECIES: DUF1517 domain-containing protein [Leptolyngbya]BAY55488.1 hypothetical protein NIES2135_23120 [Leptolyngbya boryana NIES-2135]MBD1854342.1 DUF1517 domain-containing protein [Leptolyngbya sp. FACHB-1624]MBD2368360.1 DUF1517 domain-containing protein [Leptolyngbya sp. FACHB-161]MBD2374984.1 DUF1517 domain-containing protein [Leptolyngbya sp. FACHB-238]MBD2399404.1 DUF1517 domain-containing protein [Leptolyngbya sp. FACHB-239]